MPVLRVLGEAEGPPVPQLLASRLRPPQALLELVRRDLLLRRLSSAQQPLVVVSAPAGSGKTVALAQWAHEDGRPFAWLQADEADNDPVLLLSYLASALGGVIEIDPRVPQWLRATPPPVAGRIVPALAAAVAAARPFVLVVDDTHLLASKISWQLLGLLTEQTPPGARVCLSGRAEPPLPLARLRADGRLLEVGQAELALSPDETRELLRLHGVTGDEETVARLSQVTEGWAAGLCLAALAARGRPAADWLPHVRGCQHDIARYLAGEVLERQPADIARFLVRTSILERLSPSLCHAVTGDDQAGERLHAVARDNLFVSALDDTDEWFRYHHLFAEFLQAELLRRDEARVADLHRRAAVWFEEAGQLEAAIRHWLAAGDWRHAGDLVCGAFMDFRRASCYGTMHRWLEMFTDEQIFDDPALTLAAGWIGPMAGDSPRSRGWIAAALRSKADSGLWPGSQIPLRRVHAALVAAFAPEGVAQMREHAELAVALGGDGPATEHTTNAMILGVALWLSGEDPEVALRVLREVELETAGNVVSRICAAAAQSLILADEGRWTEAGEETAAGLRLFRESGLSWGGPVLSLLVAAARMQGHEGAPELDESVSTVGAILEESAGPPLLALAAEVVVGKVLLERDDLAGAARWVRAAFRRMASVPDPGILRARLLRLREMLEAQLLLEPLTTSERRVLELLPTELSAKEVAQQLWVSHETVRTHMRAIYRKLEVHSRHAAVARARELGLLAAA